MSPQHRQYMTKRDGNSKPVATCKHAATSSPTMKALWAVGIVTTPTFDQLPEILVKTKLSVST